MDPGHGVRGREIKGAHTAEAFKAAIKRAGGEFRRIGTHPADARIKNYEYRLPRGDTGRLRPWGARNPSKTTYEMPAQEFMANLRQALKNAMVRSKGKLTPGIAWQGVTKSGLRMSGLAAAFSLSGTDA